MYPTLGLVNDSGANVDPISESDGGSKHGRLDLEGERERSSKCLVYSEERTTMVTVEVQRSSNLVL